MVSPGLIKRIARFRDALEKLRKISKYGILEFKSDFRNIDSAERNLEIAIQALIDVGTYIVAYLKLGTPMRYRDVPDLLFREGLIQEKEYILFRDIIGFRHVLVHLYADINVEKVYQILTEKLDDLQRIMDSLIEIIKKKSIDP